MNHFVFVATMKLSRRIMSKQSFVVIAVWITITAPAAVELTGGSHVPKIEGCAFVDAHNVTCWWIRPEGDSVTQYRLGYVSDADHPQERREKYCEVTEQVTENGITKESCGIPGTIYQRFTLWVGLTQECDLKSLTCVTTYKSEDVIFTCTRDNVKLTLPPRSLSVADGGRRLFWYPPDKIQSMLDFVLHKRHAKYKVEYREKMKDFDLDWEEWYNGYETSVYLPTLIPGAMYEFRVSASLDPPIQATSDHDYQREWTEPSPVIAFALERELKSTYEGTIMQLVKDKEIPESTNTIEIADAPVRVSEKIAVGACVVVFIVVLILGLACHFTPWQGWCCNARETKSVKPKTFLDFGNSKDNLASHEPVTMDSSQNSKNEENVFHIDDELDWNPETRNRAPSLRDNLVFSLTKNELDEQELGRTRPLSNLEQAFSLNDMLDQVVIHEVDMSGKRGIVSMDGLHKKEDNSCGDGESVCYIKCDEESAMPNYLSTGEEGGMSSRTLDRSASEYIADDTDIVSSVRGVKSMTTFEEYEEKQKQWEKFMLDQATSEYVPDYVMQAPSFTDDFSKGMSAFISMATEDLAERQSANVYDSKNNPAIHLEETMLPYSQYNDETVTNRSDESHVVDTALRSSCNASKKSEKCPAEKRNDNLGVDRIAHRRGSTSQHSIDSGYSPDSPDCALLSQGEKNSLLPKLYERKDNATTHDGNDSDNDTDYMAYVVT